MEVTRISLTTWQVSVLTNILGAFNFSMANKFVNALSTARIHIIAVTGGYFMVSRADIVPFRNFNNGLSLNVDPNLH